jgi:hypothetical protein
MESHLPPIISPYCIYYNINQHTNTYLGYIGVPDILKHKDGSISYKCSEKIKELNSFWVLSNIFYAISPITRPIPFGMRLFCAEKDKSFPYMTTSVTAVYDPFNIKENCTAFITYIKPVLHTIPLYLHKLGNNVFPSFNKYPPTDNINWNKENISPIFVITSELLNLQNVKDPSHLNFTCINGTCIPWSPNMSQYYFKSDIIKTNFNQCLLQCNEKTLSIDNENKNMLEIVQILSNSNFYISRFFKKIPSYIIGIFIGIFLLLILIIIVITILKNKNESNNN